MKHKVQYYETDMMGVAHHASYIHWMEEARIDYMDRMGFPYRQMEAAGILSPVKSRARAADFNGVVITMAYEMELNGERIFTGTSEHVFLDRKGMFVRMKKVMPEFCEAVFRQIGD